MLNLDLFAQPTNSTTGTLNDSIKTKLDTLVTAGTITDAQQTSILNILTPSNTPPNGTPPEGNSNGQNTTTTTTGTAVYMQSGGTITVTGGPMFYSTNTNGIINLKGVTLNNTSGILLKAGADQWGTTGANGSNITLNADSQSLTGDVVIDNISTSSLILKNNSSLKGTINSDNTAKSITVALDNTSTWNVTGNSYITSLTDDDATLANINDNGYTIYYNSNDSKNSWLNGSTRTLKGGGKLTPMTTSN